ncbi:MAG TPA: S49 family peptidase, partial [Nitrosospira sp.]
MADSENRDESWEKRVLEKLALSSLQEQRRARHWSIFFKSLTFIYLFILLFYGLGWFSQNEISISGKHTALVDLRGVISPDTISSAENINT